MKIRPIIYKEDYALVQLTQGKFSKIDVENGPEFSKHSWCAAKNGRGGFYVVRMQPKAGLHGRRKHTYLHRTIMQPKMGEDIDHINGDGLDNRRSNLRVCTRSQNLQNMRKRRNCTSSYKGVHWGKKEKKWVAKIQIDGKRIYLGGYSQESEAAIAYDKAAIKYFCNYAYLNFQDI